MHDKLLRHNIQRHLICQLLSPLNEWLDFRCTATTESHLFLVIGTSAVVHPATGLIYEARSAGAFVIEVNPAETEATSLAHAILRGPAAMMLPKFVGQI